MCRIAGIINLQLSESELKARLKLMAAVQQKGGPDDEGYYNNDEQQVGLSHRRLSLLDLSTSGHQPMISKNQQIVLVYNGEVYNFESIKATLISLGYQFYSTTDTEVIIAAYQEWGTASFSRLKGMFAFALYDLQNQLIHLVRDAQGIKPLYIYQYQGIVAFASEVKAFKAARFTLTDDPSWPIALLSMGHLPEPLTTYKEVKMMEKGCFTTFALGSMASFQTHYYTPQENPHLLAVDEPQKIINRLLDEAIQSQLVADAPIGVFLSGGIDSSLLALQAAKYQKEKLITVSLNFKEKEFSELSFQEEISKMLPGGHHSHTIDERLFSQFFEEILENMDQPGVDGINTWFVSQAAKEAGLTAVLSGVGADELFGGYPSFKRMAYIPFLKKLVTIEPYLKSFLKQDGFKRWNYLNQKDPSFEYLFLRGFFDPSQLKELFGIKLSDQKNCFEQINLSTQKLPKKYDGKRAAWFEQNYFLQNQLLKDTDTMSMQHGLEIRVPFLDDDLVNYVNSLSAKILFPKNKMPKHFLINAFNHLLPEMIWNRPKMGFTFPFQIWLKKHPIYLTLQAQHPELSVLFQQFERNQLHWSKIMSLLVMQQFGGFEILQSLPDAH
jgi:asparagine synthase (glutamine-hydrolysing)